MKKYILLFTLVFICGICVKAQEDDPGFPGGDPDVPLDGGVGLLIAAGAVYGIKKIRASRDQIL